MDTTATWFGLSATLILVVGILLFVAVWFYASKLGIAKGAAKTLLTLLAVVMVVGALWAMGIFSGLVGTAKISDDATFDISISEDLAHLTVNDDTLVVTCNVDFNYTGTGTFANETQYAEFNITVDRTDSGSKAVTTKAEVTDVGLISDDTAGDQYTLINKGTTYSVNWTKAIDPGASTVQTVTKRSLTVNLHVDSAGANWVLCNITLNADAIDSMPAYQSEFIYLEVGGNTITLEVHVINYLGTAPT